MNLEHYRRRLTALEARLLRRGAAERTSARSQVSDDARDAGDASVTDEAQTEEFAEAERDGIVLQDVQDALLRINNGTFGRCDVDGALIEESRLEAIPWTRYCVKHQQQRERANPPHMPTL